MHGSEGYEATVARCKAEARNHGHILGRWLQVNALLHGSLCERCGAMVWVTLSGGEKRWRLGGTALESECSKENIESA
jgi:hypothetical protein